MASTDGSAAVKDTFTLTVSKEMTEIVSTTGVLLMSARPSVTTGTASRRDIGQHPDVSDEI